MTTPRRGVRLPTPELLVLFAIYGVAAGIAVWQGTNHPTPSIFTDELQMTQLGRSIAETGHATMRGLTPSGRIPLEAYLSAPFWWIDDVPTAYSLIKAFGALVMALAVFPAYGLARLAVGSRWALFAAAGTGLSPALAYAPILVKEPPSYPAATLALFLIARWVAFPSARSLGLAIAACILGVAAKEQLIILFAILALTTFALGWRTERMKAFRLTWTRWDWAGAILLAVGIMIVANAYASHKSGAWYTSTAFFQNRMLDFSLGAGGALAVGLGLVPLIAGLASCVRPKGEEPRPGVDALAIVMITSILCFGFYTAVKATWLSTIFANLTLERNLIYLGPLLFAGTALFFERRGGRWWAVVAAGCLGLYLVVTMPYSLAQYPNYEAHGLSILAFANRIFRWPEDTIEQFLIGMTVVVTIILALVPWLRSRRAAATVAVVLAGFTLVWSTTTEIYAAHGESLFSERLYSTLPKPPNWLDRTTEGGSVVFLGQGDPRRQSRQPARVLEPLVEKGLGGRRHRTRTGCHSDAEPRQDRRDPDATRHRLRARHTRGRRERAAARDRRRLQAYSLSSPLRLRTAQTGIQTDGWMGRSSTYAQYDVPPGQSGHVRVDLSREGWCGKDVRSKTLVLVGPVAVQATGQPKLAKTTSAAAGVLHSCQKQSFLLPTPPLPWRAEVTVSPTFSPAQLDPAQTDSRQLGAVVSFTYIPDE